MPAHIIKQEKPIRRARARISRRARALKNSPVSIFPPKCTSVRPLIRNKNRVCGYAAASRRPRAPYTVRAQGDVSHCKIAIYAKHTYVLNNLIMKLPRNLIVCIFRRVPFSRALLHPRSCSHPLSPCHWVPQRGPPRLAH